MSLYPSFARPRNLDQAVELLTGLNAGVVMIAGGQEIVPHVNYGLMAPSVYIDIGSIAELKKVTLEDDELCIGALTVHRDVQEHPDIQTAVPLLSHAARQVGGGRQVHNRGTIGGNIVSMHPLYDIAPSLLALEAEIDIVSSEGVRRIRFAQLLTDTNHGLGTDAVLARIYLTPMPSDAVWAYQKLKTTGGAYGSANCAVVMTLQSGRIASLRAALGAASDKLIDASEALQFCIGREYSEELGAQIESTCRELVTEPLSDHQGDGTWRKAMAGVVARRAICSALEG